MGSLFSSFAHMLPAKVLIDGLIFELQNRGGISRVWSSLISEFVRSERNFLYLENPILARKNIYRSHFEVASDQLVSTTRNPRLAKYFYTKKRAEVEVPTYYKLMDPRCGSIQVCHDLMPELTFGGFYGRALRGGRRRLYSAAKTIVCVSKNTEAMLHQIYPETIGKTRVIYNPVDFRAIDVALSSFGHADVGIGDVLYVGNRDGFKNFWEIAELLRIFPSLRASVIGALPTSREISKVQELGLTGRLNFLGPLGDSEMYARLANAVFLFLPSVLEGFGMPIVEAMYLGCPVVCRDNSINREISGDLACLYRPNDLSSMTSAVEAATSLKRDDRGIFVRKEYVQKYRAKDIADQYWDVLTDEQ